MAAPNCLHRKINVFKILKLIAGILCLVLFYLLSNDVWTKYSDRATTQGTSIVSVKPNLRSLPCISICAESVYRDSPIIVDENHYFNNTFQFSDMVFRNLSLLDSFDIKEIASNRRGRCYTLCRNVLPSTRRFLHVVFNRRIPILVFIHSPGEEYWLLESWFPTDTTIQIALNSPTSDDYCSLVITMKTIRMTVLSQNMLPCDESNGKEEDFQMMERFISCSKKKIFDQLSEKGIRCQIPSHKHIGNFTQDQCHDKTDFSNEVDILSGIFKNHTANVSEAGCFLPCSLTSYEYVTEKFHKNSWPILGENLFGFIIFLDTNYVKEVKETYIYDVGNLLAAVGGNLGLLLGSCCLHFFWTFIDILEFLSSKWCNQGSLRAINVS
jgi:hypothetical protein